MNSSAAHPAGTLDRIDAARFELRTVAEILAHLGDVAVQGAGNTLPVQDVRRGSVPGDWIEWLGKQAGALLDEIGAALQDAEPAEGAP